MSATSAAVLRGPHSVWIIPPQTMVVYLTSYRFRAIDVIADEDLCIPGYEYHFVDDSEDPPVLVSQIPEGFARWERDPMNGIA